MLNLNSNAEQAFASHYSINMNPQVFAEWNYNSFIKPYSVFPSNSAASTVFTSSTNFSVTDGSGSVTAGSVNYSPNGSIVSASSAYVTDVRTDTKSLRFITSLDGKYDPVTFTASASTPTGSGFYKLTFYAKADLNKTTGTVNRISASQITPQSPLPSGGNIYYFQVIPVDENGYKPAFANDSTSTTLASDTVSARYSSTASPTIVFKTQSSAVEYDIYVSDQKNLPKFYKTVSRSYDEDKTNATTMSTTLNKTGGISATPEDIVKRAKRGNQTNVATSIDLFNGSTKISDTSFYVKFYEDEDSVVNEMSGNFYLNGVQYNKVEVYFGSNTSFDKFRINLTINSLRDQAIIFVDKFELVSMDSWTYDSGFFYPIENVFKQTLLGETLLNPLLPDSDKTILNDSVNKPVTFGYYNPDGVLLSDPKKNIMTSTYNIFKYYVSQIEKTSHTITAKYDQRMSINKIVIKTSNQLTKVTGGSLYLYNGNTQIGSTITVPTFDDYEYLTIFYDGTSWQTTGTFTPPTLTDSGILKSCVNDVTSIKLTLNFSESTEANYVENRLHLIEVSPRLELDLSNLVSGFSIDKTIDSPNTANGFPIGYINSNSGQIELSNIPVYNAGLPYTIFSEISERSTFKDLLREGIKFSINLVSQQQDFTGTIPAGVMYANKWSLGSIDKVSIDLYDSIKYNLMAIESPQYSGMFESSFDTITNLFAVSGFSDYDYGALKDVLNYSAKDTTYFWTDIETPLFDSLQSFFVSHQVGAWIDEYGVLRFKSLKNIVDSYNNRSFSSSVNFAVTDKTLDNIGSSSLTYIPNLTQEGLSYEISPRPGKIVINYKIPTVNINASKVLSGDVGSKAIQFRESAKQVWEPQGYSQTIYTFLRRSVGYENELFLNTEAIKNAAYTFGDYAGEAFLGGEAISWDGIEHQFWGKNKDNPYKTIIRNESEIQAVINQLRNENDTDDVFTYERTGRMVNVVRGKYGTRIQQHNAFINSSTIPAGYEDADSEFSFKTASGVEYASLVADTTSTKFIKPSKPVVGELSTLALNAVKSKTATVVYPKNFDASNCNFYAMKLYFEKSEFTADSRETGIFLTFKDTSIKPLYVGLKYDKNSNASLILSDSTLSPANAKWTFGNTQKVVKTSIKLTPQQVWRFSFLIAEDGEVHFFINATKIYSANLKYNKNNIDPSQVDNFGVYHLHNATKQITRQVLIKEMYACEWLTNGSAFTNQSYVKEIQAKKIKYHFQSVEILNNMLNNIPVSNKYYLWESKLVLRGIAKFNNTDFAYKPIVTGTSFIRRANYDPDGTYIKVYGQAPVAYENKDLDKVVATDVAYSNAISSPFKLKLMAVNNSDKQLVYLQTPDKKIGEVSIRGISVFAKTQVLSTDKRLEKIINSRNLKDALQIDSAWIQSERDAENLSNYVKTLSNTFNSTFNVKIYGNPLIQVGDFCQLVYSLREIGYSHESGVIPKYFFVKAVKHNYSDGFSTELTLKPMFDAN